MYPDDDFMLWFKANDADPDDIVSLHPLTPRAEQWWASAGDDFRFDVALMTNTEARELKDQLEAEGFHVGGVS